MFRPYFETSKKLDILRSAIEAFAKFGNHWPIVSSMIYHLKDFMGRRWDRARSAINSKSSSSKRHTSKPIKSHARDLTFTNGIFIDDLIATRRSGRIKICVYWWAISIFPSMPWLVTVAIKRTICILMEKQPWTGRRLIGKQKICDFRKH